MSYREPPNPVLAMFLIGIGIGFILGIIAGANVNDNYWQKKIVKENAYHWIIDPETGARSLVKKP